MKTTLILGLAAALGSSVAHANPAAAARAAVKPQVAPTSTAVTATQTAVRSALTDAQQSRLSALVGAANLENLNKLDAQDKSGRIKFAIKSYVNSIEQIENGTIQLPEGVSKSELLELNVKALALLARFAEVGTAFKVVEGDGFEPVDVNKLSDYLKEQPLDQTRFLTTNDQEKTIANAKQGLEALLAILTGEVAQASATNSKGEAVLRIYDDTVRKILDQTAYSLVEIASVLVTVTGSKNVANVEAACGMSISGSVGL